eukprot:gene23143-30347_t
MEGGIPNTVRAKGGQTKGGKGGANKTMEGDTPSNVRAKGGAAKWGANKTMEGDTPRNVRAKGGPTKGGKEGANKTMEGDTPSNVRAKGGASKGGKGGANKTMEGDTPRNVKLPLDVGTRVECKWLTHDSKYHMVKIIERRKDSSYNNPSEHEMTRKKKVAADEHDSDSEHGDFDQNALREHEEFTKLSGCRRGNFDQNALREHEEFTKGTMQRPRPDRVELEITTRTESEPASEKNWIRAGMGARAGARAERERESARKTARESARARRERER